MLHTSAVNFLLQVALLLSGAVLFGQAAKWLRLPTVIGELVGGILLGPTFLGMIAPEVFTALFPTTGAATLGREALGRLGLLLFLFLAGSEVDLSHFRQQFRSIFWTSICGMVVPFALGVALVRVFPGLWGATDLRFQLLIGTALAISALPVIIRILKDLGLLASEIGLIVLAAAAIDDLIGWALFGAILAPVAQGPVGVVLPLLRTVLVVFGVLLLGRLVCRPLLLWLQARRADPAVLLAVLCVLVLLVSAATEALGIHAVVGAFLLGVVLQVKEGGKEGVGAMLASPFLALLTPLYFVAVGLKANFTTDFDPLLTFAITTVACVGKAVGGSFGAWCGGLGRQAALAVGFGMNARGAMAIILATVALDHHLIDGRVFVSLVFMALFTSLISGPIMGYLLRQDKE